MLVRRAVTQRSNPVCASLRLINVTQSSHSRKLPRSSATMRSKKSAPGRDRFQSFRDRASATHCSSGLSKHAHLSNALMRPRLTTRASRHGPARLCASGVGSLAETVTKASRAAHPPHEAPALHLNMRVSQTHRGNSAETLAQATTLRRISTHLEVGASSRPTFKAFRTADPPRSLRHAPDFLRVQTQCRRLHSQWLLCRGSSECHGASRSQLLGQRSPPKLVGHHIRRVQPDTTNSCCASKSTVMTSIWLLQRADTRCAFPRSVRSLAAK